MPAEGATHFRITSSVTGVTRMKHPLFSRAKHTAQCYPRCLTAGASPPSMAALPCFCQTNAGGWREAGAYPADEPCFRLIESFTLQSVYSPTVLFAPELHFQFRESLFHRNPACNCHSAVFVLSSLVTQAILRLLFSLCRTSVPMHSILEQPRCSELTSLDIHG